MEENSELPFNRQSWDVRLYNMMAFGAAIATVATTVDASMNPDVGEVFESQLTYAISPPVTLFMFEGSTSASWPLIRIACNSYQYMIVSEDSVHHFTYVNLIRFKPITSTARSQGSQLQHRWSIAAGSQPQLSLATLLHVGKGRVRR